MVTHISFLFR